MTLRPSGSHRGHVPSPLRWSRFVTPARIPSGARSG
jgi:hypothetical protein